MKILSIDVGIKNLAFCLLSKPSGSNQFQIAKWDTVNLSQPTEEIKCEVPIIGEVNNQIINARIDLLVITENSILIIDYKTDKVAPNKISSEYSQQLKIYEKLIKNLYPNHEIRSAILWLESLRLDML